MPTVNITGQIGNARVDGSVAVEAEGEVVQNVTLPAAKAGTLSTRTSDTDGTLTLAADHGITDAAVIDVFWTDAAGVLQCAYGATVGTVSGTSVPFTGAGGAVLPAEDYAVTACVVTQIDQVVEGDDVKMILAQLAAGGHLHFRTSAPASIAAVTLQPAAPYFWIYGLTGTNPLDGEVVATTRASNAGTTARTLALGLSIDSVA